MSNHLISIRKGVNWVGAAQVGKILLQLAGIFTLARILPPSDYGLMAMAATVTAFAALFRDFGTGAALIQKKDVDGDLKDSVFWFNSLIGLTVAIGFIALSSPLALFFDEPRIRDILLALSPVFFFSALGIVHQSILERESNFKSVAITELVGASLALVCAIGVAWMGGGVYALVTQSLVGALCTTFLLWLLSQWRPRLSITIKSLKEVWRFSGNIFLFNVANYFQRNADSIMIGRFLGAADLGLYNIAYRLLLFPLQNFTFVITRASFPAYSRNQENRREIARHYTLTLQTIAYITAPTMAFIWATRETLISVLLGEQWLPAAAVLAWLAPVGFLQSIVSTSGMVLNSIGRSDILRNLGFIGVPFLLIGLAAGMPWGITGVACGYFLANLLWLYPVMINVFSQLEAPFILLFQSTYRQVLLAVALAASLRFSLGDLKSVLHISPSLFLCILATAFFFTYGLFSRSFMPEFLVKALKDISLSGRRDR